MAQLLPAGGPIDCVQSVPIACKSEGVTKMNRLVRFALVVAAVLLVPLRGYATDLTVDNGALGASVKFSASGTNLIVTLTNGAIANPSRASEILTGVFFDIAGDCTDLKPISAVICPTCSITAGGTTDPGGSVGGEWGY